MDHLTIVNAVAMMAHTVGDYIYRVEQPSIALGKTGKAAVITVSTISPWFETLCMSADILILHLLSEHDILPIIEKGKRHGVRPYTLIKSSRPPNIDNVVKKPKTAIVIPRSLRRGISNIRYYDTFRFTKRSLASLGMTIRIFYEGINIVKGFCRLIYPISPGGN